MSRRSLAALIAGAAAAMACYFLVARPPGPNAYLIFYLGTPAVALAFLAAGLAAWLRWPGSRLGLLFSLVGYFTVLPALDYLDNSAGFTIGNAAVPLAGAALAHLGLAWPTGRLRSRFERGVVVAEYASAAGLSLLGMLFWDPAFSGCDATCPANLLLVRGSRPAWDAVNALSAAVGAALTVIVVVLIIRHWRSARGWSRQAMAPLVWIAVMIGAESLITNVTGLYRLPPLANLVFNGWAPLVALLGPVLFVISTVRARTARGALGTAIVDLEPGAPPGRLRDTLARALGDSTLQLAFRDRDGFTDTSGLTVDPERPDPGRAVVPLTGARAAVLVYDASLDLEPQLVRLTRRRRAWLEHSGCRPRSRRSWSWCGRPGPDRGGGDANAGSSATCTTAQQRLVTADLGGGEHGAQPGGRGRSRAGGADRGGRQGGEGGADRAARAGPRHPPRGAHRDRAGRGDPGAGRAVTGRRDDHRGAARAVPGRDRGHRLLRGQRGAGQRGQARQDRHRPGEHPQASWPAGGAGQRRRAGGARPERGSGLAGLADRVASAGGVLRVDSPPGAGTRLEADIPCP